MRALVTLVLALTVVRGVSHKGTRRLPPLTYDEALRDLALERSLNSSNANETAPYWPAKRGSFRQRGDTHIMRLDPPAPSWWFLLNPGTNDTEHMGVAPQLNVSITFDGADGNNQPQWTLRMAVGTLQGGSNSGGTLEFSDTSEMTVWDCLAGWLAKPTADVSFPLNQPPHTTQLAQLGNAYVACATPIPKLHPLSSAQVSPSSSHSSSPSPAASPSSPHPSSSNRSASPGASTSSVSHPPSSASQSSSQLPAQSSKNATPSDSQTASSSPQPSSSNRSASPGASTSSVSSPSSSASQSSSQLPAQSTKKATPSDSQTASLPAASYSNSNEPASSSRDSDSVSPASSKSTSSSPSSSASPTSSDSGSDNTWSAKVWIEIPETAVSVLPLNPQVGTWNAAGPFAHLFEFHAWVPTYLSEAFDIYTRGQEGSYTSDIQCTIGISTRPSEIATFTVTAGQPHVTPYGPAHGAYVSC